MRQQRTLTVTQTLRNRLCNLPSKLSRTEARCRQMGMLSVRMGTCSLHIVQRPTGSTAASHAESTATHMLDHELSAEVGGLPMPLLHGRLVVGLGALLVNLWGQCSSHWANNVLQA